MLSSDSAILKDNLCKERRPRLYWFYYIQKRLGISRYSDEHLLFAGNIYFLPAARRFMYSSKVSAGGT